MTRKSDTLIPKLPLARLIKEHTELRLSDGALEELSLYLEECGKSIAELSVLFSKHAGRRTIMEKDVTLAIKEWNKKRKSS